MKQSIALIFGFLSLSLVVDSVQAQKEKQNKLPVGCAEGQVAKWQLMDPVTGNGVWVCAEDIDTTTDVTALQTQADTNTSNINTNATSLAANWNNDSDQTTFIGQNTDDITGLLSRVSVLEGEQQVAYTTSLPTISELPTSSDFTPVLTVPAGSYVVQLSVRADSTNPFTLFCSVAHLQNPVRSFHVTGSSIKLGSNSTDFVIVYATRTMDFYADATLSFRCIRGSLDANAEPVFINEPGELTAVKLAEKIVQ